MLKLALIGGLLAALSISGFSLGNLVLYVIGAGVALMVLGIALEITAAALERIGLRWSGFKLGTSERLQRSGS